MKADRPAGEGLAWWWDQYTAIGDYLYVVPEVTGEQFTAMF